jgi:hypothetical protein
LKKDVDGPSEFKVDEALQLAAAFVGVELRRRRQKEAELEMKAQKRASFGTQS